MNWWNSQLAAVSLAALVSASPPIDIAEVWSGHPVGFALLTHGNTQYVAFYDKERRMTIAWRTLDVPSFRLHRFPDPGKVTPGKWSPTQLVWDSHNSVTMAVDSDGQLHVTGNMHCHPLVYFRTTRPGDPTSLAWIGRMISDHEDRCTYPRFLRGGSGELIFAYRHGRSGNGVDYYNRYDPATRTWKRLLDTPLLDGQNRCNAYSVGPVKGPDGDYHLCWVWRDTPDCATNHDLCYARSKDLVHWETSDGKHLTLPITAATSEIVDPVPVKGGIINGNTKIGFDSTGRVILSYHKHDTNGHTQLYNARREANGWKIVQASGWKWRWDFSGGGTIGFGISVSPVSLTGDGKLAQTWSHREYGSGGWFLDEATLKPIGRYRPPRTSMGPLRSTFPGMRVRSAEDRGQSDARYVLRWETLDANRDKPREGELPPPSMLQLYTFPKRN
ncbi:MAG: hypothetical protein FJ395_05825 [Verrucomicrobia bacterium]|nr:hypothetical protein [Verrucomicrobiota bacterium]